MKAKGIRMEDELIEDIEEEGKATNRKFSDMVRHILVEFFKKEIK